LTCKVSLQVYIEKYYYIAVRVIGRVKEASLMEIADRITIDEKVRFGKPVIKGTRVPVDLIISKLAGGMAYEEVMAEYDLTRQDILAALDYAAKRLSDEEIRAVG
jgi:uncharacterized protein (DUF433 family)